MRKRDITPAGPVETLVVSLGMLLLGVAFLAGAWLVFFESRGSEIGRLAVAATAAPTGVGLIYLGGAMLILTVVDLVRGSAPSR